MDFLSLIKSDSKPPAYEKWQEVFNIMGVHTQMQVPTKIFKERRPLESNNEYILKYREDNYRAITKDDFDKAIDDYIATAQNLDVTITNYQDTLKEYVDKNVVMSDGLKHRSLLQWVLKKIGAYKQTDPNAVIVVLPKHPESEIIPNYLYELPNFDKVVNKNIDVEIKLVSFKNIISVGNNHLLYKVGKYAYGDKEDEVGDYFFAITPGQIYIIIPSKEDKKIIYTQFPYYKSNLKYNPVISIGTRLVVETDEEGDSVEFYISDFHGAAAWGDLAIGQGSDLRACEVRFVYPRHWRIKVKCDNIMEGCHNEGGKFIIDNGHTCGRCNGTGYIMDTSPMGTMLIDQKNGMFSEGKFTEPEGFITPPSDILKHSADREEKYLDRMQANLCIMSQNMTNQSGESKKYDVVEKVNRNTTIVTDLYLIYVSILNFIDLYRSGKGEISITFPEDFDVKNTNDILVEYVEAKKNNLPNIVLVELTKKYMLKKFGNNTKNNFILNFLSVYDKLFAHGLDDLQNAKAIFGSSIGEKTLLIHNLGYQILSQIIESNESTLNLNFDDLKTLLDKEIDRYLVVENNSLV